MTLSLLDAPDCLDGPRCDVGLPAASQAAGGPWQRALADATQPDAGTAAFRRRATAECLDTLATLRAFREPLPNETWQTPYASECRALAQVNAIVGLGPNSLQHAVDHALDPDLPDPGRVFAVLLTLGCVAGPRWLAPLRDLFVAATQRGPSEAAAAIEALGLAAHPELAATLRPLLTHEHARVRAGALRVLSFRRELAAPEWSHALEDAHAHVVVTAAGAPLAGYDPLLCERALAPLLSGSDETRARAALRAGLGIRLRAAYLAAKAHAQRAAAWADSIVCLAAFGFPDDAGLVRAALHAGHTSSASRAAGLLGEPSLVADLIVCAQAAAEAADPQVAAIVAGHMASALQMITGLDCAGLSPGTEWQRRWAAHADAFEAGKRYRHGRPLTIAELRHGLEMPNATRAQRQCTYLELMAATEGAVPRFDAHDFVAVQRRSLRTIDAWLARPDAPAWPSRALH